MDFRSESGGQPAHQATAPASSSSARSKQANPTTKLLRYGVVTLLFSVTILVIALTFLTALGNGDASEGKYVNANQYQAVFLTNGQVYFGNVNQVTNSFIRLKNIYYLTQNT